MTAELIVDSKCILGEGPVWHPKLQQLFWVDIEGKMIHVFDLITGRTETHAFDRMPGALAPIDLHTLLVAFEDGLATYDWLRRELLYQNHLGKDNPAVRANDGKCDPNGNFWIGTMHLEQVPAAAALYRFTGAGQITLQVPDRTISNGLAWSGDHRTMYYIDSADHRVYAFDFDPSDSSISRQRTVIEVPVNLGTPDGMCIDQNDKLWVAHWGGSCVRQWDPVSGEILAEVNVPAPHVTSCTFGGPDLDELYITTALSGLSDHQRSAFPQSGGVFRVSPGAMGRPTHFFKLL